MIPFLATARFPPPEFSETGHHLPTVTAPTARAMALENLDVAVLVIALGIASWLSLRKRSRRGIVWLGIFSMLYFGFWRKGCICSIGSIQNVAQAIFDPAYAIPFSALAFFIVPLVFALLFGRSFCAAVCPHGALQDLMVIKPVRIPSWLEQSLRLIAFTYLGLAMIFAATGGGYIICQYDPFITIFRLSGSVLMVSIGIGLLVIGLFIGRPYCRFLCPYGVLLGLASSVSKWRVTITPDTCTNCRLCEQSCPFNAINKSSLDAPPRTKTTDKRRLGAMLALLPVFLVIGFVLGGISGTSLAKKHRVVDLAERIHLENTGKAEGSTDASAAFRATGKPDEELFKEALALSHRYFLAGRLCGIWVALVVGLKLVSLAIRRKHSDYEADQTRCLSCARCFKSCPQELQRLGIPVTIQPLAETK